MSQSTRQILKKNPSLTMLTADLVALTILTVDVQTFEPVQIVLLCVDASS
jgi:hypothetical protein